MTFPTKVALFLRYLNLIWLLRKTCYVLVVRTEERVSVSAFVDPDDHERLVERARLQERSVSAELRVAIREHLAARAVTTDGRDAEGGGGRR